MLHYACLCCIIHAYVALHTPSHRIPHAHSSHHACSPTTHSLDHPTNSRSMINGWQPMHPFPNKKWETNHLTGNLVTALHPQTATTLGNSLLLTGPQVWRNQIFRQALPEGSTLPVLYVSAITPTRLSTVMCQHYGTKVLPLLLSEQTKLSQCAMDNRSVQTGNKLPVAPVPATTTVTYAPVALHQVTELKTVLEQRKCRALTPYHYEVWQDLLDEAGLLSKYPKLPQSIWIGFNLKLPKFTETQTPPNRTTIIELSNQFNKIINLEITKQRYLGPITRNDMESLIGPFQTSPFSIIPKPGRPDNFRILQNYSFPHNISNDFPNPSINSAINSDDFPTTWGTFTIISLLIHQLPPNS